MAAYTSVKTGNWSDPTVWGQAGGSGLYPGSAGGADTVTIAATHTVTLDVNVTGLGTITSVAGTLTWSTLGHTLNLAGNLTQTNAGTLIGGPGGILEFDNGGRTWTMTPGFSGANITSVQTTGTSAGSRFIIRTATGGTNVAAVTTANHWFTSWAVSYVDFLRVGDATHDAIALSWAASTGKVVTFTGCTFTACGRVMVQDAPPATSGWAFTSCVWAGTVATNPLSLNGSASPSASRLVDQCVFDKAPSLNGNGSVYTRNYFANGFGRTSSTTDWSQFGEATAGDGYGNLIRVTVTSAGVNLAGGLAGNYVLVDTPNAAAATGTATAAANSTNTGTLTDGGASWTASSGAGTGFAANASNFAWCVYITGGTGVGQCRSILSNTTTVLTVMYPWDTIPDATSTYAVVNHLGNPHVLSCQNTTGTSVTFTGNVCENTGADNNGDLFSGVTSASTTTGYTVANNLVIPSASKDNPFDLVGADSSAKPLTFTHNTVWVGGQPAVDIDDGSDTPAGKIPVYKSNLVVADPARTYCVTGSGSFTTSALGPYHIGSAGHAASPSSSTVTDCVSPANAVNNGDYGLSAGAATNGFNTKQSSAPNATGRVTGDPRFVDPTRNFGGWAYAHGYSVSLSPVQRVADGLTAVAADPTRTADAVTWVKAGFAPRNSALKNAGHDSVTIGAVEGVFASANSLLLGVG